MSEHKFSFNKADLGGAVREQKPLANDKWVKVVVGEAKMMTAPAKCGVGEDQIIRARLDIIDPKDGQSRLKNAPSIFCRLTMPVRQDDLPKYAPPDYAASFWGEFSRAFLEIGIEPKPGADGKFTFKGKKYGREDLPAVRDQIKQDIGEAAVQTLMTQGKELLRCVAYCKTKVTEDGFLNAKNMTATLPANAKLATAEELFDVSNNPAPGEKKGGKK